MNEPSKPKYSQEEIKRFYLEDTRDILVGYDGETTVEGLKALIDEVRERITHYLDDKVVRNDIGVEHEDFDDEE